MELGALTEILKIAALPSAMFAVYFGFLKSGHKVGQSHTYEVDRFNGQGISQVTLTNLKYRSTPIFALYAVRGDVAIKLHTFKDPLVLKSYDSVQVNVPLVSQYVVDGQPHDLFGDGSHVARTQIYYSTVGKWKRCILLGPPPPISRAASSGLWPGKKLRHGFTFTASEAMGGKPYSQNVVYIVNYQLGKRVDVAFIDAQGILNWNLKPNVIPASMMSDQQAVADLLLQSIPCHNLWVVKTAFWNQWFSSAEPFHFGKDDRPVVGRRKQSEGTQIAAGHSGDE